MHFTHAPARALIHTAAVSQTGQLQPARGFDRLAALGFSADDIENFRQQFHSQSYSNYLDIDVAEEECAFLYPTSAMTLLLIVMLIG